MPSTGVDHANLKACKAPRQWSIQQAGAGHGEACAVPQQSPLLCRKHASMDRTCITGGSTAC